MGFRQWLGNLISGGDIQPPKDSDPIEEEVAGLNFRSAIEVHRAWKARLQAVIDGASSEALSVSVVSSDSQCTLGKWIHGPGQQRFGSDPDFQKLVKTISIFISAPVKSWPWLRPAKRPRLRH